MPRKVLYFDTETTGLDPYKHALIQLAFAIEIDGVVKEVKSFHIQPLPNDVVEEEALKVNGITREQMAEFPPAEDVFGVMIDTFNTFIDPFDKTDKFYPAGFNVNFDMEFLSTWIKKMGNKYGIGSYCHWRMVDPFPIFHWLEFMGIFQLENYKLATICQRFGIPLTAHDAKSDILATREIIKRIETKVKLYWKRGVEDARNADQS